MIPRRLKLESLLRELENTRTFAWICVCVLMMVIFFWIETNRFFESKMVSNERAYFHGELTQARDQLKNSQTSCFDLHQKIDQIRSETQAEINLNNRNWIASQEKRDRMMNR